jgi:imidazolonepropionase
MRADRLWCNARLATLAAGAPGLGVVESGVVAAVDGRIAFAGQAAQAPRFDGTPERIDCGGRWITPGLVDCHTHLVHAADRAAEFEARLDGADYADIVRRGGGILSTVNATRGAGDDALLAACLPRVDALCAEGVTTLEVKSGYGLELATEQRQLRVARTIPAVRAVNVATTFLGAHTLPPEWHDDADGYVDELCTTMLPAVARERLADSVDAYCEQIAFSPEQTRRVFVTARQLDLPVRLHADQLSNQGGAALAAEFGALSADHLEYTDTPGVQALARAGTIAVLLPGAYYSLRQTQPPPIAALRAHGVPIAVATDCNPGTSPLTSLLLAMNMAATLFRLTVEECLAGVTRHAARALGRFASLGSLEAGKQCDLAIWNIERPAELVYRMGFNPLHARVWRGR